ncbi:unnamed protein product [Didymodactylos carnosus]|uniref:Uncharacterized protein n=1 Tax=Didymodactylos carnosus TaxID=1234261 RepID=A0A815BGM1_9BILA|nr:unnamed protein product [Didymodactylos carnosus]CAF4056547.1 unnamed protein product [Didymodactylos carnosus]
MEETKAQNYIVDVNDQLLRIGTDIEKLKRSGTFQTSRVDDLSTKLNGIGENLRMLNVCTETDMPRVVPKFEISFRNKTNNDTFAKKIENKVIRNKLDSRLPFSQTENCNPSIDATSNIRTEGAAHVNRNDSDDDEDESSSHSSFTSQTCNNVNFKTHTSIKTCVTVDRIASDGENILFTSKGKPDVLVYHFLNQDLVECKHTWPHPPVSDVIWCEKIKQYLCAALNGIYSVTYTNKFKIEQVVNGNWAFVRISCNHDHIWIWMNTNIGNFNGINLYSYSFQHMKTIDFNNRRIGRFVDNCESFCVHNQVFASLCVRKSKNSREVFYVTFCDLNMKKIRSIPLGEYAANTEIRSDVNGRFFVSTGMKKLWVVKVSGEKQFVKLQNNSCTIAILNEKELVVGTDKNMIEYLKS